MQRTLRVVARLAARATRMPMATVTVEAPAGPGDGAPSVASFGFDTGEPEHVRAFAAAAAESSGVLLVRDATRDDRFAGERGVTAAPFVRFSAAVPLVAADGSVMGSLCVFDGAARPDVSDDDVESLRDLAALVVDAVAHNGRGRELLAAHDTARRLATTDPLTGLSNRRMLEGMLDGALALARRTGHALAVLMIGLDHGEQIRAPDPGSFEARRPGERQGDARRLVGFPDHVLVEMAARLERGVREHDLVARVGEDEFVVVLQAVDRAAVAEAAGRLHEVLTGASPGDGAVGRPRVSVGVALHPADGEDLASLLRGADLAMHDAQAHGGGVRRFRRLEAEGSVEGS